MARAVVPGARHWPLAALVVASALWGGAIAGTKYALRGFDPVTLLSVELVAATAALWAVLVIRGYRPPPSWPVALLLGLLEPALAYLGDTFGLSLTSASDGAIISGLESALVVILAALILGEAISRAAAVAIALGLGGLLVMTSGGGHSTAAGDLCVAGGVLSASLYSVVAKRFASDGDGDALSLTTWQFTAATAVALAVATARWTASPGHLPSAVAPRYWLAAAAVGVGGFGLSFLLYNTVISAVDVGWAAIVLNLIPVFGLASSVIFLREDPARTSVIGACLIGGSVACFTVCDSRAAQTSQLTADTPAAQPDGVPNLDAPNPPAAGAEAAARSRYDSSAGPGGETASGLGAGFGLRGSRAPASPPRPR
jgi:O-acetylserine/cysteine efflux transporter